MRGPGIDSLSSKNSNKISKNIFSHAPTLRVAADLIAQRTVRRAGLLKAERPWKK